MLINAKVIALSTMVAVGIAAPATMGLVSHYDVRPLAAHTDLAPALDIQMPAPVEEIKAIDIDEVVLVIAPRRHKPAAEAVEEAEIKCSWHQSQTLANSRVRVCDIERSRTLRSDQLLSPGVLPRQLIKRDTPSPSGLID
jgi:hypothetical protein